MRPSFRKCGQSSCIFFVEISMSSGICSTPIIRPCGPTIKAIQAVKYPEPEPMSRALAPSCSWSVRMDKAYACWKYSKELDL